MRIVPGGEGAGNFKSMAEALGLHASSPNGSAHSVAGNCGTGSDESQPRVILKREGDRIVLVQIICGCGRLMEIDCLYT